MKGFTFIELIIVIAVILILGIGATPTFINLLAKNNLNTVTNGFKSSLRKAQSYAISGKDNNAVWGVCIFGQNIRLFSGSCSSPARKEEISITNGVNISGFSTVTFEDLRGEPSSAFTFTLSNQAGTKNIIINSAGNVNSN